jgi:HSP20 family molecular chaperone IbpA
MVNHDKSRYCAKYIKVSLAYSLSLIMEAFFGPFVANDQLKNVLQSLTKEFVDELVTCTNDLKNKNQNPPKTAAFTDICQASYDIVHTDDKYIIIVELPGCKKDDITITIDENSKLSICAEHKRPYSLDMHLVSSIKYGKTSLQVPLPDDVNIDNIVATSVDGVLQVSLDRKTMKKNTRKISIV